MAILGYTQPFSEDVEVSVDFLYNQPTSTASVCTWYPFGQSGLEYGANGGEDNSNKYSFSILDFSVLSEQSLPFAIAYTLNGVAQPVLTSNINHYSQSLGAAEKHLKTSATIPEQTGFSIIAYPLAVNSENSTITETFTMSVLVIPPKVSN